jgi:hypothetical protein
MTTVALTPERRLSLDRKHEALVLSDPRVGERRTHGRHPLLEAAGPIVHATLPGGEISLIARARGRDLFRVDAALRCETLPIELERIPRSECIALFAVDALFLVVTENGVLALDPDGRERWRIDETTAGWGFVGETDAALYFSDANGNLIPVDARTGAEVDG